MEGNYAVTLQPVLIQGDESVDDVSKVHGLECVDEVYGFFDNDRFRVRVVNVGGLGFSEVCGFRRPMIKALPPQGTVIKLKEDCANARAIGLLSQLGYGSIYRISLQ